MSPSFLFSATNKNGKTVTERVEAETLSAAKYKLEIQGYTCIEFFEGEISNDVRNLFTEKQLKLHAKVTPKQQVSAHYKAGIWNSTGKILNAIWLSFLMLSALSFVFKYKFSYLFFLISAVVIIYISIPSLIYQLFITAHFWADSSKVKIWGKTAKVFNRISINKIPEFEIDKGIACAEAREGNINAGLMRMAKYQNDPKVSKRLMNNSFVSIYSAAKNYDEVLKVQEISLREGNIFAEELIDYAVNLTLHHKKTSQAREVINRVFDMELNFLGNIYMPFCQGLVELEEGNTANAEFYLREASKRLKPFDKNTNFVGIRSIVKTILAISLGKRGDREESRKLFQEAKPYLVAHNEDELLQRCEEAIS